MDQTTILALSVLAVVSPFVIEFIKTWLEGIATFWITVVVLITSLLISIGVLAWQGLLDFGNVEGLLATLTFVFTVTTVVYNTFRRQVKGLTKTLVK